MRLSSRAISRDLKSDDDYQFIPMTTTNSCDSIVSYEAIKLGIDAHVKCYWVGRQVDGFYSV